ncbi:MAG: metallophosphoesterase [Bacilli bacterium]|nr:metallophosphoesterase [Bacilli bacterium]
MKRKEEDIELEEKKSHKLRIFIFIIIALISFVIVYGRFIEPDFMLVNEINIEDTKLDKSFGTLKIVHFTDILYGSTTDIETIKEIVNTINDKKGDIVIYTGDLVYEETSLDEKAINEIEEELSKIKAKYGKYYVSGDNDTKFESYDTLMANAGFVSLNDDYKILYNEDADSILISGIKYGSKLTFLDDIHYDGFKINIMHTPDTMDKIDHLNYNYVFAGHSLYNQINISGIDKLLLKKGSKMYYKGHYKTNDTNLYISNGFGSDTFKFRLNSIPSINVYKIKNTSK